MVKDTYINPKSIMFMDKEENLIHTGKYDWRNKERCEFVPSWNKLIATSCCEEESEKIKEFMNRPYMVKFPFQIVFMVYTKSFFTYKWEWQIYQHPWFESENGEKFSKDEMIKLILEEYEVYKQPNK